MHGVAVDLSGSVLAAGFVKGGLASFGDRMISSRQTTGVQVQDAVLWKVSQQGTTLWAVGGGGDGSTHVYGVALDDAGDAVVLMSNALPAPVTGVNNVSHSVTFGNKTLQLTSGISNPALLWKVRSRRHALTQSHSSDASPLAILPARTLPLPSSLLGP